jgi:hypothetical protein
MALPRLTDLTMHSGLPALIARLETCHSLRRLNVMFGFDLGNLLILFQNIPTFAPFLSYLRFTDARRGRHPELDLLTLAVNMGYVPRPDPDRLRLPATMQQILIMPRPYNGDGNHAELVYHVLLGTPKVQGHDDRVVLLRDQQERPIGVDWLDLINGGEGCWNTGDIDHQSKET